MLRQLFFKFNVIKLKLFVFYDNFTILETVIFHHLLKNLKIDDNNIKVKKISKKVKG